MAINALGPLINACLHDVPTRVQEIAFHGVRHGASVALAVAQVQTVYELHTMETDFLMGDGPEEHEELTRTSSMQRRPLWKSHPLRM